MIICIPNTKIITTRYFTILLIIKMDPGSKDPNILEVMCNRSVKTRGVAGAAGTGEPGGAGGTGGSVRTGGAG